MKILVGYEKSGTIREALRRRGYDAWSCDLQSPDDNSPHHIVADIWTVAGGAWDMGIFHPMCTYLTVSAAWAFEDPDYDKYPGVGYHQKIKPETLVGEERRKAREIEIENFKRLDQLPYPTVIENPGSNFVSKAYRKPTQIIQPYDFGDDASKATGLWLSPEFTPLISTKRLDGRRVEWPVGSGKFVERWANQTDGGQNRLTPSDDRWNKRSKTFDGIAEAIAEQLPRQLLNPIQTLLAV